MEKEEIKTTNTSGIIGKGRLFTGVVVSRAMKDTVVVSISRFVEHPMVGKYIKSSRRLKAHDVGNKHEVGEKVTIQECRPISKDKRFRVV